MSYFYKKNKEEIKKADEENKLREERFKLENDKKGSKKKKFIIIIAIVLIIIGAGITYGSLSPGKYDDFAKCLTEKGAVMYGEDWCQYTQGQKRMFGRSFKYINYEVKTGLKLRPTWIINGETHERVQSFEALSELTGCKYQ